MAEPKNIDLLRQRAKAGEARAQYMLAAQLSASGADEEVEKWLEAAFRNGEPDAGYTLATRKFQTRADAPDAARMLDAAARNGSAVAKRLLGVFCAEGLGGSADWARAVELVIDAAKQGDISAKREIAMLLLTAAKNDPAGALLLEEAAKADATAGAVYVRLAATEGDLFGRDIANNLLQNLTRANYPNADALSAALSANGGARISAQHRQIPQSAIDWASVERALIDAPAPPLPGSTVLCDQPAARCWRNAFSPMECEYVIAIAAQRVAPSLIVDPHTGERRKDAYRTSLTATLGPVDLDLPLIRFNQRLAALAGRPVENGEFLSVLNYAPGQQYRPHFDWLPPGVDLDRGGQRVTTALLYLNDDYEGGETHFETPDIRFKGAIGDVMVFHNVFPDNMPDNSSRHASLPVTRGAKWIGSKWFREKEYNF